jgi:hypothetical protein
MVGDMISALNKYGDALALADDRIDAARKIRKRVSRELFDPRGGLLQAIGAAAGVAPRAITGSGRLASVSAARKAWVWALVELCGLSYAEISRQTGRCQASIRSAHRAALGNAIARETIEIIVDVDRDLRLALGPLERDSGIT